MMAKTDPFTQFYPTGFTQWAKLIVPTLHIVFVYKAQRLRNTKYK